MTELNREHCQVCRPGTPALDGEAVNTLRHELDAAWSVAGDSRLHRELRFANFSAAFGLATRVALLCEQEQHHADMRVGWGYLEVDLTTHAAGGLTRNDFIMAARIDRIAATSGMRTGAESGT